MIVYVYPGPLRNDPICRILLLHGLKRPTRYILFAIFVLQFRNDEVFHYKNVMSVNTAYMDSLSTYRIEIISYQVSTANFKIRRLCGLYRR